MLGKRFLLKTNHISLANYFKQDDLNSRQARWNAFLSKFDINMQHVKDKKNRVAYVLSRNLHGVYELYYNQIKCKFLEKIKIKAEKDFQYQFMWQQAEEARKQEKYVDYRISKDQLLTFKKRIYVPNRMELKEMILNEYH